MSESNNNNVIPFAPKLRLVSAPVETPVLEDAEQEHYRVGYNTKTEMVTLTILGQNNSSMTLSMSDAAVDHMVRMLVSAVPGNSKG